MDYRTHEKTGTQVSLLGFGNMRLPTAPDGTIDDATAKAMIDTARAGGVNYFDTAWGYHDGASEPFLGRALADYDRGSYLLATKLPIWLIKSRDDVMPIFEEQLKRLGTDYFDFYLFHSMNEAHYSKLKELGLYEMMTELKRQGRVRRLGFSFHGTPELLAQMCGDYEWDFAQLQLNYIDWDFLHGREMYATLEQHGIQAVVMEPVRGGRLADLGGEANALLKTALPDASIASWALRWVAALPNVLCVLSGMSAPAQVADNLHTLSPLVPLTTQQQAVLDKAAAILRGANTVPCTGCRYCMPCPQGVDIPGMLELRNSTALDGSTFRLRQLYAEVPAGQNAGNCIACGACEAVCPQTLPIAQLMGKLQADTAGEAD